MAAQIFNLGKLRFTYKGTYSGATTYQLNDVVKYTNNLYAYINTGATAGNAPTDTAYWSKMIDGYTDPASGTNGQFLQTTGSAFQFATVSQVPSQTGNAGKFLKTDGTSASWSNEFGTLGVTGDLDVGTTAGELYVGFDARNDAENLGAVTKSVQTKALTSNVATITTSTAHGFAPFQFVTIALSPADPVFDGTYEIVATPTTTTFTYSKVNANVGSQATTGTVVTIPGYTNPVAVFKTEANDYAQIAFRNSGTGAASSTDFIAYANNGTDFAGYIDMGITSSNFNDPEFTITGANDGYIFMEAPVGTTGHGNLVLATGNRGLQNKIVFAAGGLASDNTQMVITPDLNVHIEIPTPSTSPTTGALTVVGGVGISGDVNIQGSISFSGGSTSSQNLSVNDPIIFVGNSSTGDTTDLGFVGKYVSSGTKYAGLLRDASDGIFKLFTGNTSVPTTTANFAAGTYAPLQVGALTVESITASGSITLTGGASISGTTDVQELREQLVPVTIASNTATCDWTDGNLYYISTAPSANFTVALTNVPTDINKVMTVNLLVTQGATGYIPSALTIAGVSQTIKWAQGASPTPTSSAGKLDIYNFTLIRTAAGAWIVLGGSNLNF